MTNSKCVKPNKSIFTKPNSLSMTRNRTIECTISLLFFILLHASPSAYAQQGVSASYDRGQIIVHSSEIEPLVKDAVQGFSVNYSFLNKRGEAWRHLYNYPNYGLSYNFTSYGNKEELGNSHSVNLFTQFPFLAQRKVFDIGIKGGVGLAYFGKVYDELDNPNNVAISSHVNISGDLGFYSKIRIEPFFFEYFLGLNHYSNALTNYPNKGINVLKNKFVIGVELEDQIDKSNIPSIEEVPKVKNELWGYIAGGLKVIPDNENRFVFLAASLNYSKQLGKVNKLGVGIDFINDESLTELARIKYGYTGEADINFRYGPNLQGEFLFGKSSLFGAYGFYFGSDEYYVSKIYYKVGYKYSLGKVVCMAVLRAVPLFKANAFEIGIGYSLQHTD